MTDDTKTTDEHQLAQANIANLTNFWRRLGVDRRHLDDGHPLYVSTSWPHRAWFDWGHHVAPEYIDVVSAAIAGRVTETAIPMWAPVDDRVAEKLGQHGFAVAFSQVAMVLALADFAPSAPAPSALTRWQVDTPRAADRWAETAACAFEYPIDAAVIRGLIGQPDVQVAFYTVDNEPVGTGLLFADSQVAGLHMIGVVPEYRRRGIARHIMHDLLGAAQNSRCAYATLQASAMAKPLYTQLGFHSQFTIINYVGQPG